MADYCQLCGNVIQGQALVFQHTNWSSGQSLRVCSTCYLEKPHCIICGLPVSTDEADPICTTCQSILPRCLGCGQLITSRRYYVIEGHEPYCENCRKEPPSCDVCGRPLGSQRWQLSDGRTFCDQCYGTTINYPSDANRLYKEVGALVEKMLGLKLNVPTGLALVDRNQLAEVIAAQDTSLIEPAERTLGIYARRGIRRGIYVQTGLPQTLFLQVAAHEIGHAWQGENCPLLHEPIIREGFAEWVAFKVLHVRGDETQRNLMLQRTDLYGQGLRWALALETKQGWQAVIDACRIHIN